MRFLQSKEFKPLGSPRPQLADVRIIAATHKNLEAAVKQGSFREDLYYRLNVIPLMVPPLRERKEDIVLLAHFFLAQFRAQFSKDVRSFSPEAIEEMKMRPWPGNVRELENRIQRAVVLAQEPIIRSLETTQNEVLSATSSAPSVGKFRDEKKRAVEEFERGYVQRVLEVTQGNLSEAARVAGVDRKNFWTLAQRYHVRDHAPRRRRNLRARAPENPEIPGDGFSS